MERAEYYEMEGMKKEEKVIRPLRLGKLRRCYNKPSNPNQVHIKIENKSWNT